MVVVQPVWNHESDACRAQWYASKAWDPWTTQHFHLCKMSNVWQKKVWTASNMFFSKGCPTAPHVSCSAIFQAFAIELHLEMAWKRVKCIAVQQLSSSKWLRSPRDQGRLFAPADSKVPEYAMFWMHQIKDCWKCCAHQAFRAKMQPLMSGVQR